MEWENTIRKNKETEYEDNIMELLYKLAEQLGYYYASSGKEFDEKRIMKVIEDARQESAQAAHEYRYDL